MKSVLIVVSLGLLWAQEAFAESITRPVSRINPVIIFDATDSPQEYCLALNIYYEARSSNLADKAAVADVVINRVLDTRYPNTICEVVKQGKQHANGQMKLNKCQFSWYCDGKSDTPMDTSNWAEAQQISFNLYNFANYRGITEGATHYHAEYIKSPNWTSELQLVGRIGSHIYYRWE
jgi:spore germination cell wall hydrolase CwlJ-like protein|tara:strand:+ start:1778 stop:2311 length:534 start_codon:yes stop_codon:yes gene_type:complete